MTRRLSLMTAIVCTVSLAGCDKIEAIQEAQAFVQSASNVNEQRVRVLGDPLLGRAALPGTAFDAVPTSGSATFQGAAFLGARDTTGGTDGFVLVGDTTATLSCSAAMSANLCRARSPCAMAKLGRTGPTALASVLEAKCWLRGRRFRLTGVWILAKTKFSRP